jgi:hypothetical protein
MTKIAITTLLVALPAALPVAVLASAAALAGCSDDSRTNPPAGPPRAVIVAGDFNPGHPGVLSTYDPASGMVRMNVGPAMAVGDDPMLRHIGRELLIVNRNDGNNVTILDDQTLAFKEQLGTGPSSNPQDVAVIGNKLYVPTYGTAGVTVLTRGSTATAVIDLSVDDPDRLPNCESIYLVGKDLYVACQLLDNSQEFLPPRGPGKVYVIDTATDRVRATLTLGHQNPFSLLEQVPVGAPHAGDLVVGTVRFDDGSGCVERITPGATPVVSGCLVSNADLGGYASRIAFEADAGGSITFFAVPTTFPDSNLRAFDMPTSLLWSGSLNKSTEIVNDVVVCPEDQIVVADTTKDANGLRVYEGSAEKTTAALPIGLPPTSTHGLVCY